VRKTEKKARLKNCSIFTSGKPCAEDREKGAPKKMQHFYLEKTLGERPKKKRAKRSAAF
jgi:hypothetical protein